MSDMYTGWDGNQYPWPPPEGWYQAIDGRWWAPGTGPNPPPQGAGTAPAASTAAETIVSTPVEQNPANDRTSQMPQYAAGQQTAPQVVTTPQGQPGGYPPQGGAPVYGQAPPNQAPPQQVAYNQAAPAGQTALAGGPPERPGFQPAEPVRKGGGIGSALLIIVGMIAMAILGGLGYFYLTDDDGSPTDTAGEETAASTDTTATGETTPDATDTTAAPSTDTTVEDTTTSESTDTTLAETVPDAEQTPLGQFRQLLSDNGLASDNLGDNEINTFADSFCNMATNAADPAAFDEIREAAVEATESSLSDGELRLVIDAAIVAFCPDEATRLGITL
ncbi:MAG: hypothetical protein AAGD35_01000 [Actinomycetota bacterium]